MEIKRQSGTQKSVSSVVSEGMSLANFSLKGDKLNGTIVDVKQKGQLEKEVRNQLPKLESNQLKLFGMGNDMITHADRISEYNYRKQLENAINELRNMSDLLKSSYTQQLGQIITDLDANIDEIRKLQQFGRMQNQKDNVSLNLYNDPKILIDALNNLKKVMPLYSQDILKVIKRIEKDSTDWTELTYQVKITRVDKIIKTLSWAEGYLADMLGQLSKER